MQYTELKTLKKVSFHTLGCRLNFSESGSITQGFVDRGFEIVEFGEPADVVFLNTCTVTDGADASCRQLIRKAKNSSPSGKIVVAGCYAQMEADKIKAMEGVDLILGNQEKYKIFDYLHFDNPHVAIEKNWDFQPAATTLADSHTRAFLKIQDGCNYVCSFCIIPFARGRSRTITIEDAVQEAKKLINQGFKEIVLTGVNIGEYESTSGQKLASLVEDILNLNELARLRLSSVEPNTINAELLEVLKKSGKYQDHFHIPLQSGSDKILTSMRRKYSRAQYVETLKLVKSYFPHASIGADIIVGYPGETEEDFNETFKLLRDHPVTHFHVFPYSKRKGTTASKLGDQVSSAVKKERVRTLIMLGKAKLNEFAQNKIGSTSQVLFEKNNDGIVNGYTPDFIKVQLKTEAELANQILPVKLESFNGDFFRGSLIS